MFMANTTDLRSLNMTSGLDECGNCVGIGRSCMWRSDLARPRYACGCIEPFVPDGSRCRCPNGYSYVPNKKHQNDRFVRKDLMKQNYLENFEKVHYTLKIEYVEN